MRWSVLRSLEVAGRRTSHPKAAIMRSWSLVGFCVACLAVIATASRSMLLGAPRHSRCVDARFLVDVFSSQAADCVLLSFSQSAALDLLCPEALHLLHASGVASLIVHAVGTTEPHKPYLNLSTLTKLSLIVFLLGTEGDTVEHELRRHITDQINFISLRKTTNPPLLSVVDERSANDVVDIIHTELYTRKWFQNTVAVQRQSHVTLFISKIIFEPGVRCGINRGPSVVPGEWNRTHRVLPKRLFPTSVRKWNLKGCVLNVALLVWPPYVIEKKKNGKIYGLDMELLSYISQSKKVRLNISLIDRSSAESPNDDNDDEDEQSRNSDLGSSTAHEWNDALASLLGGDSDVAVGGFIPTRERLIRFQFSVPYTSDKVRFYMERIRKIERWKYPIAVLTDEVWILLTISFFIAGFVFKRILDSSPRDAKKTGNGMLLLWGLFVDGTSSPSYESMSTCTIILAWILFSMHFTSGYRAALAMADTRVLTTKGPTDIKGLQEAAVSKIGAIKDDFFLPMMKSDPQFDYTREHLIHCADIETCLDLLDEDPTPAVMMPSKTMNFIIPRNFLDVRGRTTLQPLDNVLYAYPVGLVMAGNSPIACAVNSAIRRARDFGFPRQWERSLDWTTSTYIWRRRRRVHSGPHSLDLKRMIGHFTVVIIGSLVSICAFIAEIVYSGRCVPCAGKSNRVISL